MLILCGCCLAVTDSLSALRGDAVITVVLLRWCVTADVTRSIGPVDSRHHSDCLLHFYYSYHSLAAAVAARRPTLLLKPGAEITPEANKPSHTHTERERVVAARGLCLAHQHTETLIQAECVCVWRSKRKRGKVRKGPQSKHVWLDSVLHCF